MNTLRIGQWEQLAGEYLKIRWNCKKKPSLPKGKEGLSILE
jgi:hypothetical protein